MTGGGGQFVLDLLARLDHGGHHRGAVVAVDGLVRPVLCGGGRVLNINFDLSQRDKLTLTRAWAANSFSEGTSNKIG